MLFTDIERRFETVCLSQAAVIASQNAGGIQDIEDSTLKWLKYTMSSVRAYCQQDLFVDQLTPQDIYDYHAQVLNRASAVTANNYLRAINIIYNRLLEKGIVAQNPASYVPYAEEPDNYPKAIHLITFEKLRQHADIRSLAMIDLLWASGCRIGGLLSIRIPTLEIWEENGQTCLAVKVKGKGRFHKRKRGSRTRHIYAHGEYADSVVAWLKKRPAQASTDKLFTTQKGTPLCSSTAQSILRNLRIKAQISPQTPSNYHAFRHAFAIRKLDEGVDIATVSAWLGHKDPAFTARTYCIRTEDELRNIYFKPSKNNHK